VKVAAREGGRLTPAPREDGIEVAILQPHNWALPANGGFGMNASLQVLASGAAREAIGIPQGKFVIGREPDCDFRSESPFVSRHHCVLLTDGHTVRLHDLCSRNGTFINGSRVGSHESILLDGDTLSIGDLILQVKIDIGEPTEQASGSANDAVERKRDAESHGSTADLVLEALRA
jgi:pSer/pThr/pTyr-binding forkhead associated (FHA) protein